MDLDCFQWHIFNTCVSINILVLYMLKNNNYTCLKKTIHFLMKLLIEKKMSYIQWFHLCSLGTKWTYIQIFVKYSLKLSFIFFKQNYVFLNQVNLDFHENWPKRIKLMPHYQIKYVSNYLFPSSLFQKMDTYNESRINTPNMTFQTPTFSISVA